MNLFIRLLGLLLCGLICESVKTLGKHQSERLKCYLIKFAAPCLRLNANVFLEGFLFRKPSSSGCKKKSFTRVTSNAARNSFEACYNINREWKENFVWWLFKLKILRYALLMSKSGSNTTKKKEKKKKERADWKI